MKTLRGFALRLVASGLLALSSAAAWPAVDLVGQDVDIFTVNPNIPSQVPNVLIVLDNTSNWSRASQQWPATTDADCTAAGITGSQQGDAEVCAIYKTVSNLDISVKVGLMMFNGQDSGAYIRFPVASMTDANRTKLKDILKKMNTTAPEDKGPSNVHYDHVMNDAFRYFNSLGTYSAVPAGSPGGPPSTSDANGYPRCDASAYTSADRTTFKFTAETGENACGYDYIIFIGNGFPNTGPVTTDITAAAALLNDPSVVVNTATINTTGANTDVWARFLFNYGVKLSDGVYRHVSTYTIDVCNAACDSDQETLLRSMATVSFGSYYKATSLAGIETALKDVFAKVQAVSTVFAATTLPVSINVRGTNLNQVYIGVFKPDANLSPRWYGNLKQYKLGVKAGTTDQLEMQDDAGAAAVNLATGFIWNTAKSIWTEAVTGTGFWGFKSTYPPADVGRDQDTPDGDLVEKGGAAQKLRQVYPFPDSTAAQTRKIYTCTGACTPCNGASTCPSTSTLKSYLFNTSNTDITSTLLGTLLSTTVDSLAGSGTTATASIAATHDFTAGEQLVVAGATPDYYNGTVTVLSSPAPTATQFSYTVTPSPNATIDTANAYVTFTSGNNTLTPGSDKILVSGATPTEYNTTTAKDIAAVLGNVNQVSYAITGSPTTKASGYVVSGVRLVDNPGTAQSSKVVYSSSGSSTIVTVTLNSHGYSSGDAVTISGVTGNTGALDPAFNVTNAIITRIDANNFSYTAGAFTPIDTPSVQSAQATTAAPSGFTWATGDIAIVCTGGFTTNASGVVTACGTSSSFNSVPGGTAISSVTGDTFNYATSGTVAGSPASAFEAVRVSTTDTNTWTLSSASAASAAGTTTVTLQLSNVQKLVAGQLTHPFVIGETVTVNNLTCRKNNGTAINCLTGSTSSLPTSFTATLTAVNNGTFTVGFAADNLVASFTVPSTARVVWSASASKPTYSSPVSLPGASIVAAAATVKARGTIYSTKTGDLTTKVSSIASQGFATGTITVARASAGDPAERDKLIDWVRGHDNKDNENSNGVSTDVRASIHGDVLHSRPAVVNYNRNSTSTTTDDNDVYIFYGSNDGLLRAIKGGSTASGGGKEQWSFVAPEFFGRLKRQRDQSPTISSNNPRNYFFDGPISVYTLDANRDGKLKASDGDKVYLFVGMRRGGRLYYALDVSDPADPKLMWKRGCKEATGSGAASGSGGCDGNWGEIGQTWSEMKLGYLRKWPDKLVLMFGAGYDQPVEDPQSCFLTTWDSSSVTYKTGVVPPTPMTTTNCPPAGTSLATKTRSMGRGVFIVDALTGEVLWRAGRTGSGFEREVSGMDYSIASNLAVLRNRNNTANRANAVTGTENVPVGYLDRIYAVDTGGQVWRLDVSDSGGNFAVTRLAAIAQAPATGVHAAKNYRKFLFSPDVVYDSTTAGSYYDAVLVGSGDREHPFDMVVDNRFYMFKDFNYNTNIVRNTDGTTTPAVTTITDTSSSTDLFDVTNNCIQNAAGCDSGQTQAAAQIALNSAKGWKLRLTNIGEKTIATATTAAGTVIFNTNQPATDTVSGTSSNTGSNLANQCRADLGTARQYGLSYKDGTAAYIFSDLPTQNVEDGGRSAEFAGGGFLPEPVPVVVQIDGKYYQTVISGVQLTNPGGLKLQTRVRTYWYRKVD